MEMVGYGLLALAGVIGTAVGYSIFKSERRFKKYVGELRQVADNLRKDSRDTHELHFRDTSGNFQMVKIIIDYGITDEEIEQMQGDWVSTTKTLPPDNIKEFVFSPKAVREMRANGVEPDDVVRDILIASGRMQDDNRR